MKNAEIREELIRALSSDDLVVTHPTLKEHGARFVDYTKDGHFTLEFPIRKEQCNGWGLLQGGNISSFMDDNYGLFAFIALSGAGASTIDMSVTFHKAVTIKDGYVRVTSRVVSAGKRIICLVAEARNPEGQLTASSLTNLINAQGLYLEY
ncbi:MAG: PaaI family thioesterase [Spirochaetia bacterium]|jgi:uncharacterized protein (TIGR00369 family)|nr:PaaI family thioesterase [Spirochaetia bacterium]